MLSSYYKFAVLTSVLAVAAGVQAAPKATTSNVSTLSAATPNAGTLGEGTLQRPAKAPAPAFGIGGEGFVAVKNWDFGMRGTIKTMADMNAEFQYQDQFKKTINGGDNYGSVMVAANTQIAVAGQPVEDPAKPVREILDDSLKTYLVPLNGATVVSPQEHNVGSGSFVAKWKMPNGGAILGQDLIFETRVRYVTPPYYWFAIWTAGNLWNKGAEYDLVESFGYDNGGGATNFDGRYWHSSVVGGTSKLNYHAGWGKAMREVGVLSEEKPAYDATQWHTWTWLYRKDDTFSAYLDGKEVQSGTLHWTLSGKEDGTPLEMYFLFDGAWGHTKVAGVNKSLPASELNGKFYEWDYSRVYLRGEPRPQTP